ncbi:hypothetical protein GH714_024274 [Hevea brasiliensis]|uniref:Mediator of RNA polymerase II transcription subunit 1 n=1 Tax=Hevea brasiliensis TaxID=3981 RepID=A0A6A6KVH8_HEVBR|nr:hypothetical protein GH714_024274 [Hevea brasiliensis]
MERSEPTLVPEWLRSSGSVSGGGSSAQHFASSSSHSDVSSSAHHARNRNSKSDFDSPRSAFLDRASSSNSRRTSSNGSAKHAYSSFSRSHRDKDRERDKESNHANGNGLISGSSVGSGIQKTVFDKDFPSLGSEERQGVPDIGRVSSPGLSTAVQSLPVGSSALIGGEGWTSALVEVPTIIGNSSCGSLSAVQTVANSAPGTPSVMASLNMAEALTQVPSRTRTAPQLSVQTQRLEELAIKQSRQLIPVTPSMPKSSVLNSSDKSKSKTVVRSGEMNMAAKSMQQQPSSLHPANQAVLGGHVKDVASPTNSASRAANSQLATPTVPSAPSRSPNNTKLSSVEHKSANLNLISGFNVEKRPLSQTQSRNDFFNLLKKKTSTNTSAALPDSASAVSSPASEKSCDASKEVVSASTSSQAIKNGAELTSNGDTCEEVQRFSEEEAAFLRSLGWEENSGEDEGLTEDEINAFYQQCMKLRPTLKLCPGMQQKLLESHAAGTGGASSELSSSDSGLET